VDLVRYATSIDLACRQARFPCDSKQVIDRYLAAYRASVEKPALRASAPSVSDRLRRQAPQDRTAWLTWVDTQMGALAPDEDTKTRRSWSAFRELQRAVHPDRPSEFYDIVRFGELKMGVGSALERKLLFRIRGRSGEPADDEVLEARSGELALSSGCVWRPSHNTALHVLLFMSTLGPRMPDVIGFVSLDRAPDNRPFWVQSWNPGYVELAVTDLQSQAELEELVTDAAQQLGGHFWTRFPEPLLAYQRYAQLQAFDAVRDRAKALALKLSGEVLEEHAHFKSARP
jgi:hypothetical protein